MGAAIREAARDVPVAEECDLCVVGGGTAGLFAAVTAARLGLRTAVIERNGFFGGVATAGLVNIWHSLEDTAGRTRIIGGLTAEVLDRLSVRGAVRKPSVPTGAYVLNTEELKIELDALAVEAGARPFLHAVCVGAAAGDGRVSAAVIEDKSGRRAVRARFFVDATGDGDLLRHAGVPLERRDDLQPPTACALVRGLNGLRERDPEFRLARAVFAPGNERLVPPGFLWSSEAVGQPDTAMVAGTRVAGADCSDADQLTKAEIEGRRQVRAICDILRALPGGDGVVLVAVASAIGVRETNHARCLHTLTQEELLSGTRFPDAIANGTYPVDVHHSGKPGITFRRLDGTETWCPPSGGTREGRWRPEGETTPFYQIPYRSLVPAGIGNVLAVGRLIGADRGAYGAIRVLVNCNQTGEAAGAAAFLSLRDGRPAAAVDAAELRVVLKRGGSAVV